MENNNKYLFYAHYLAPKTKDAIVNSQISTKKKFINKFKKKDPVPIMHSLERSAKIVNQDVMGILKNAYEEYKLKKRLVIIIFTNLFYFRLWRV